MAPDEARKDFLGFILETQTNEALVEEFFSITDKEMDTDKAKAKALHKFFKQAGFTEIKEDECENILKVRIRLECAKIPSIGDVPRHGEKPCPGPDMGY